MHDYGLENERHIENNHWKLMPYKKVIMRNVKLCEKRITVKKIAKRLRGWGAPELERAEAIQLTEAVVEAINANQSNADISHMFNIQVAIYSDWGYVGTLPREAITNLLY